VTACRRRNEDSEYSQVNNFCFCLRSFLLLLLSNFHFRFAVEMEGRISVYGQLARPTESGMRSVEELDGMEV
jgi:hypothetical protein